MIVAILSTDMDCY